MDYLLLYEDPPLIRHNEVPDFIIDLCEPEVNIDSQYEFDDFKDSLRYSDYSEEWAWYRGIGKGTRNGLKALVDHELPVGLRMEDRRARSWDWQLAGEFLLAMVKFIREVGLVGSKPYRDYQNDGRLYFAKEVDLS